MRKHVPTQTSSSYLQVEGRVRRQPGLLSYKTLVDIENPNNYCVLTKWKSEVRLLLVLLSLFFRVDKMTRFLYHFFVGTFKQMVKR